MHRTVIDTFHALCDEAGTPFSLKASLAAGRGDWGSIIGHPVRPSAYTCVETFQKDYQIYAFFKKYPDLDLGIDLAGEALKGFWEAEKQCFRTNERLSPLLSDKKLYGGTLASLIDDWRKEVFRVLGKEPPHLDELTDRIAFGPGATFSNRREMTTIADKLSDDYTRTSLTDFVLPFWDETPWSRYAACGLVDISGDFPVTPGPDSQLSDFAIRDFTVVRGNRFTTVRKDATKDRGICVEPSLNVAYQLAVGKTITALMARYCGWNKKVAKDYHMYLARLGSLTGATATIDLSMASDTVAINLVRLVVPKAWFSLLMRLRSPFTFVDGHWVKLEKFSSMGNGFTFELETLLFHTLAVVVGKRVGIREDPFTPGLTTSVFGDDIVVPRSIAATLVSALKFFGFTPNEEKTFLEGPFRESCGGDYWLGRDVRPHFQRVIVEEPHHIIALANGISRYRKRRDPSGVGGVCLKPWFTALDGLPSHIRRLRGPEELGDLVIADADWIKHNPIKVRRDIRYLSVWRPVPIRETGWEHWRPGVQLAVALFDRRETDEEPSNLRRWFPIHPQGRQGPRILTGATYGRGIRRKIANSFISGYKVGRVPLS